MAKIVAAMGANLPDGQPDSDRRDLDPLQDFLAEAVVEPPDVPESQQDSPAATSDQAAAGDPTQAARLASVERLLERTVIDVSALKSDLATLVSVVDDIKKRQSRRVEPRVIPPDKLPARLSRSGTAVAAMILMAVGFALWGVYAVASYDTPEPLPIDSGPAEPVEQPVPTTTAAAPPAQIQNASAISAVLPERNVSERNVPARDAPMRDAPARAPSPGAARSPAAYVGTLTIDASPAGEVFLNRKNVGRTPLRLEKLRAGSHLVWIERDGYRRWTRVVPVTANRISRVTADLDPLVR